MKKFLAMGMILCLSLMVLACGGKLEETSTQTTTVVVTAAKSGSGSYKIGIATREITNDFNRNINDGAQAVIEAAGGTVVIADANADFQKHNENIENLINSGIDGLVVQLGDVQQLAPIMARAKSKGIPVVTTAIGSHVPNTITDVGGDNPLLAILATESLLAAVGYVGDIYVVWVPDAPLLETRKRILEAVCADHPGIKIHEVPAEHNPAKVQAQIEDILTANPAKGSIAGIFGTYDGLVSGASKAIRRAGRDEIKLVAIDGDRVAFQMLFQGGSPFVATVVQDSISIGKIAGETIIGVLNGTINPDSVPPMSMAQGYVASRKNGVAAAERYWGPEIWEELGLDKEKILADYPQSDEVIVVVPTVP